MKAVGREHRTPLVRRAGQMTFHERPLQNGEKPTHIRPSGR